MLRERIEGSNVGHKDAGRYHATLRKSEVLVPSAKRWQRCLPALVKHSLSIFVVLQDRCATVVVFATVHSTDILVVLDMWRHLSRQNRIGYLVVGGGQQVYVAACFLVECFVKSGETSAGVIVRLRDSD